MDGRTTLYARPWPRPRRCAVHQRGARLRHGVAGTIRLTRKRACLMIGIDGDSRQPIPKHMEHMMEHTMSKRVSLAVVVAAMLACSGGAAMAADTGDAALKAAIAGSARTPANAARDGARHPYETLTFFGIKPTMTVVELAPGGGWYTEILGPYLHDHGKLIAAGSELASSDPDERKSAERFMAKLNTNPAAYGKVEIGAFAPPTTYRIAPKGTADMVLTFRNIHNWIPIGED